MSDKDNATLIEADLVLHEHQIETMTLLQDLGRDYHAGLYTKDQLLYTIDVLFDSSEEKQKYLSCLGIEA